MTTFKPNPDFIKNIPEKTRKKWSDALRKAYVNPKIWQTREKMTIGNQYGKGMCCLMVGHVAFDGTNEQRNNSTPFEISPFAIAMKSSDPILTETRLAASGLNDTYKLDFLEIADLVDGKEVTIK